MTVGDFQAKVVPPKSRPRRRVSIRVRIVRLPNQSINKRQEEILVNHLSKKGSDERIGMGTVFAMPRQRARSSWETSDWET